MIKGLWPAFLSIGLLGSASWGATPLTFQSAFSRLMDRDTKIQTQRANLAQAKAAKLDTIAAFLPTLAAQANDQKAYFPIAYHNRQGVLEANLNLFRSGADEAGFQSQRAAVERERFQLRQTTLDEEQANLELLVHYIQAAQAVEVANNLVRLNEQLAKIENVRYHRGLIPLQDSQNALVELNNSKADLSDAQSTLDQANSALSAQLGASDIQPTWPWKTVLLSNRPQKLLKGPFRIQSVPAWNAATKSLEREDEGERSKFRGFLPSLDLSVTYGYQDYLATRTPGWGTTVTFTIPLFNLKSYSDYRVQAEQKRLAEIAQEKTKRETRDQWRAAKKKLALAIESARERDANVKLAKSLYQDNQRRLRAGRSSMNDVVTNQKRLSEAESSAINGWADAHLLFAQLCHSLGRRLQDCL